MAIDSLLAVNQELKAKGIQHQIEEKQNELEDALTAEDFQTARMACLRILYLFSHNFQEQTPQRKAVLADLTDLLYSINGRFIPFSELTIGTFVNARISEINKERHVGNRSEVRFQERNGIFRIVNEHGTEHQCYVKDFPDIEPGMVARLWITNIKDNGYIIYLEPRLEVGDKINILIESFASSGDPYFRFLSYDGFIKTNQGGTKTLIPGQHYRAKITYQERNIKPGARGHLRCGIVYAIARKHIDRDEYEKTGIRIAKARQTKIIF